METIGIYGAIDTDQQYDLAMTSIHKELQLDDQTTVINASAYLFDK